MIEGSKPSTRFDPNRIQALILISAILFLVLIVRLVRLQIISSDIYLRQSQTNRVRVHEKPPLRGIMYDRNGRILVDNYPSYTLMGVPEVIRQHPETRDTLLAITSLDSAEFDRRLNRIPGNRYRPVRLIRDVPFKNMTEIEERRARLPGVHFMVEVKRAYPQPVAPHSMGHIGELKPERADQFPNFEVGDIVGLSGLEQVWNDELTGEKGYEYLEVDAKGRTVGPLPGMESIEPTSGADLILTLDTDLQKLAETLLDTMAGAAVVLEIKTGEVLTLASIPNYPADTFSGALTLEEWETLQNDPKNPLLHRAIQGEYPPGSTFKMAVLAAGLASGNIDRSWGVYCAGGYQLGRRFFKCWKREGHGEVGHRLSIESSCDVYYYLLGRQIGIDVYHDYISRFPFGVRTGIDLPHERPGVLPSREYFERRYGSSWTEGNIFNISIGQGEVLATPLQLATFAAAIANEGTWIQPHLVQSLIRDDEITSTDGWQQHEADFPDWVIETVQGDMLAVTEGARGTAHWLYDPRLTVAGKTGTSQNPHGLDHALFVAYAPFEDPQIALAVVVEHGEHGSTAAAPIVYKLIREYYSLDEETWQQYRWGVLRERANRERAAQREQEEQAESEVQE